MSKLINTILILLCFSMSFGQHLPSEVSLSDGKLTYGGNVNTGFYATDVVHKLEITLTQSDWFRTLDGTPGRNGTPGESLVGTLTFNDTLVLDSVLVSIKGQTSDTRNNSEKKSFKIEIDELKDQRLMGYDNLNLNCAYEDHSSMREVVYYDITKHFVPALKGNIIDLYINGQYWGPYNNIQQIEGTYIKEWFTNNNGTRWRAVTPDGETGSGGQQNRFGEGYSTLNYNGPDSNDYNKDYTLKSADKDNPWQDLIDACHDLNNLPIADLYDSLKYKIDVDRALWFLVQEICFSDDDSYINKGGMDYYVYWDEATDRIIPMEVDGNSVLGSRNITWGPFYNANNVNFPLLNRLMQNDELRQRYLAHLRTALDQHFTVANTSASIDAFAAILDQRVQDDPKKLYTYSEYTSGVQELKNLISTRINTLSSHTEVNRTGVTISNLQFSTDGGIDVAPQPGEEVNITVEITGDAEKVLLYYGLGFDGVFERVEMHDDGNHGDQAAGDNIYGGEIPGCNGSQYVRYYIEAIKNDEYGTASYHPVGAEYDVFIYQVEEGVNPQSGVVINEFMASNETSASDNAGEFNDWVELFNNGDEPVDLSGYYLSDNSTDLRKWSIPEGTMIGAHNFLIIWADNEEEQNTESELHCNFKLSASGEELILSKNGTEIIDAITFGTQTEDLSFARQPNGTGEFAQGEHTFRANNNYPLTIVENSDVNIVLYPNPANEQFTITTQIQGKFRLNIQTLNGQIIGTSSFDKTKEIDVSEYESGLYVISVLDQDKEVIYHEKLVVVH